MTDCGCETAKAELENYLHNELQGLSPEDIAEHLANCDDCSGEHLVGRTLLDTVRRACKEQAPEDLRAQVLHVLRGEPSSA